MVARRNGESAQCLLQKRLAKEAKEQEKLMKAAQKVGTVHLEHAFHL